MLSVTGLNQFYYLRGFHDMRCKYERVLSIIHQQLDREPQDGDVFIVMSKDHRLIRLFSYDSRSYSLYEKRFVPGYKFMHVEFETPDSLAPPSTSSETTADKPDVESESHEKEVRLYRQGKEYRTMTADKSISHECDITKLPEGSIIIKRTRRYSYEQVSSIIEHDYEVIRYKTAEGIIRDGYFPLDGAPEIMDVVPGTHASSTFMAYLAFNKYVLATPLYREIPRILDEDMRLSRMTLTNWLEKGSFHINRMIGVLKECCLEKDSIINCDETWCRVVTLMPLSSLIALVNFMCWRLNMSMGGFPRNR